MSPTSGTERGGGGPCHTAKAWSANRNRNEVIRNAHIGRQLPRLATEVGLAAVTLYVVVAES